MGLETSYIFHNIEEKLDTCCCVTGTRDTSVEGQKSTRNILRFHRSHTLGDGE